MINERVKNKYIRATSDEHGARIIQFLVENGGRNEYECLGLSGYVYSITKEGVIVGWEEELVPPTYTEMHLPEELKRGDLVEVSDDGEKWVESIFLAEIEGAENPFATIYRYDQDKFKSGIPFRMSKLSPK